MAQLKRINTNFTAVANTWLKDRNLSLKAKGMLCLLQSVPEGWDFNISGLAQVSRDGVDSVKSTIAELREAGYLEWERVRNEQGKFEVFVCLHEKPINHDTETHNGKPVVDKPAQYNKEIKDLNIDNTNVLSMATPTETQASKEVVTYGNASINEAFDLWQKQLGYPLKASTQNRRAVWNMLRAKDKGAEWLTKMLALLAEAKKDKYSGIRIANFADLQRDWEKLLAWGSSQYAQQHGTTTQDKEFDNLVAQL